MLAQRNVKLDLFALVLLALVVFLTMALFTYDPADPPSALNFPPRTSIANACGRSGALAAYLLFNGLGLAAYYAVFSLAAVDGVMLTRRAIHGLLLRTVGWLLSLLGVATLAAMALSTFSPGPAIGAGGYLGAAGRGWLEMHFASAGAYILVTSAILGGLLLCTDYVLVRLATLLLGVPMVVALRMVARKLPTPSVKFTKAAEQDTAGKLVKSRRGKTDLDAPVVTENEAEEAAETNEPTIKFNKKAAATEAEEAADDEAEEAVDEAAEESSEEQDGKSLRVKKRGGARSERQAVMEELEAASHGEEAADYELPSMDLLLPSEPFCFEEQEKDVRNKAKVLEKTFESFGFQVKVVEIETGPVIAQFEVELEAGLRLSKITSLADDLAIALRVPSVRIVAPIPGKNTVGIEVPNAERQLVRLREVMEEADSKAQKMRIPIFLGSDVAGNPMVCDLTSLPHLLIAGRTGTGKSVCLNTIIMSMLMTRRPDEVRMLFIDPKMVELTPYMKLPHLMHPVVTDMKKAEAILAWAVEKMEERYSLLARAGVRHISVYNQLGEEELMERLQPENDEQRSQIPTNLPYIVIVADEMADLMMTSAKEVEHHIIRLAQKSRAVGIHLVLATQKPTVDVITGLIKSNLPARISFQVASRTDSRVVLDEMGADKLLGNGDMLFLWPGTSTLLRGQGAYVSDEEINNVVSFVGTTEQQFVSELVELKPAGAEEEGAGKFSNRDELYEAAIDIVVREGRGSVSLLQRALGIGYGRAARLIDYKAEDRIVGQYAGSQAREVLITPEKWAEMSGQQAEEVAPQKSRNKIVPVRDDSDEEEETPSAKRNRPGKSKAAIKPSYDDDPEDDEAYDSDEEYDNQEESDDDEQYDEEDEAEDEELDEDHYAETA
jgi:S-DNA-T family DNA segregation ATPase FtsK/SpoIIIE